MKLELGAPTEDFVNEIGNEILVYKTKEKNNEKSIYIAFDYIDFSC